MKPIKLKFTGINSYRTLQVVDFEHLGADGLFGIFGPTGSGKSSILDAITLALYGGVDRTINNTRGIIHQLENSLEVSFEFELGGYRYLVDRRYERNPKDPDSATAKQARLRQLNSNKEEVLASKPQEVNAKIEEIIGIHRDEFSRAVVLPQGKFDQFLRMTGGDRAAMLEHLFNLEQFGEELVVKVKNEAIVCTKQLERIEGEEQGLGDCSEEAVNQAISELKIKHEEFTGVQKNYADVDKSYKEALALQELFLKRKTAEEKKVELEQEHEAVEKKQSRLNTAERAEPLRELITRQKELNIKIDEESITYQNNTGLHNEAAKQHENAKAELELAEKTNNLESPQLQERKAQYQGALDKQRKLLELQNNAQKKQQELDKINNEITTIEQDTQSCQGELDNARTTLDTLQKNRLNFIINPDEKESIEHALEVLLRLEGNEKQLKEKKETHTKRKKQNEDRWTEVMEQVHVMLPQQVISAEDDIEEWTKALLSQTENDLESVRAEHRHALIINSAAELVKELHEGGPCPVCGSCEHPQPAETTDEVAKLDAAVKVVEKRLKEIQRWEGQVLKLWHDWGTNEPLVREAWDEMEKAQKEMNIVLTDFESARGSFDREGLRNRKQELAGFEKQLHEIEQNRETLQKKQEELNGKLQEFNGTLQTVKLKDAAAQEALKNLKTQIEENSGELQKITGGKDLASLIQETEQSIQRLQKVVDDAKRKEAETRAVTEELIKKITALEATLKANRGELAGIDQRLTVGLEEAGFVNSEEAKSVLLETAAKQLIRQQLEQYRQEVAVARNELENLDREINSRPFDEAIFEQLKTSQETLFKEAERLKTEVTLAKNKVDELQQKQERWQELQRQKIATEKRKNLADDLANLLRGRRFVSFLAQEHLRDMVLEASNQLGRLTGQRYALELAKDKDCEFVIRDDYNGGNRRMVNSLSGGEIFMTSLALALALSSKIQLRGRYPLGFFFLDEGFGTLDEEKLDKVMNALEKLHDRNRMVGVISHVKELKERLPRYLEVVAAGEDGSGSEIRSS
jgi:exonuclease SbcC